MKLKKNYGIKDNICIKISTYKCDIYIHIPSVVVVLSIVVVVAAAVVLTIKEYKYVYIHFQFSLELYNSVAITLSFWLPYDSGEGNYIIA